MLKKINLTFFILFLYLCSSGISQSSFQTKLLDKYKTIDTLYFDFTQKIGEKIEFGSCYIKYSFLMRCEYPNKKKIIIADGKRFAIVQKKYKKVYYYSLKKTPLFYILDKENILNLMRDYEPSEFDLNIIGYEITGDNSNKLKIFFDKKSLDILGWKTIDAYSNEVNFLIRNVKKNISVEKVIFKIPREEDL